MVCHMQMVLVYYMIEDNSICKTWKFFLHCLFSWMVLTSTEIYRRLELYVCNYEKCYLRSGLFCRSYNQLRCNASSFPFVGDLELQQSVTEQAVSLGAMISCCLHKQCHYIDDRYKVLLCVSVPSFVRKSSCNVSMFVWSSVSSSVAKARNCLRGCHVHWSLFCP
jgi:hypothetical protein